MRQGASQAPPSGGVKVGGRELACLGLEPASLALFMGRWAHHVGRAALHLPGVAEVPPGAEVGAPARWRDYLSPSLVPTQHLVLSHVAS